MSSSANGDKLRTLADILRLEQRKGFRDDAVIGGLDAFLQRWWSELRPALDLPPSYAQMSTVDRSRWVEGIMQRIRSFEPSLTPHTSAPSNDRRGPSKRFDEPDRRATSEKTKPVQSNSDRTGSRQATVGRVAKNVPASNRKIRISLSDDVSKLRGVSSRTKARLSSIGVETVEDLIYHFPHRHDDFTDVRKISQVVPGETQTIVATIWEVSETGRGRSRNAQAVLGDETGNIRVVWFNQGYLAKTLTAGKRIVVSGEAKVYRGRVVFQSPDYDFFDEQDGHLHAGRLVPIYPLTEGIVPTHLAQGRETGA